MTRVESILRMVDLASAEALGQALLMGEGSTPLTEMKDPDQAKSADMTSCVIDPYFSRPSLNSRTQELLPPGVLLTGYITTLEPTFAQ